MDATLAPPMLCLLLRFLLVGGALAAAQAEDEPRLRPPLRVFVLVGQSNMVGHGIISDVDGATGRQKNATLEWLVDHAPDQFGMLKKQQQKASPSLQKWRGSKAGKSQKASDWTARSDVLIACNNRELDDVKPAVTSYGHLQAGKCAGEPGQFHMGPELGFGWTVGDAFNKGDDDRILLLKIAWGGKSLAVDFRPPSSGGTTGPFYQSVVGNVKNALEKLTHIFPNEAGRKVELTGFAWHQGWNDGCKDEMAEEYEANLANLIRDVRKDLVVPDLPFAVAASGMIGYGEKAGRRVEVVDAELKVATYPEFKGNVASIDTRPYARGPAPASPTNLNYHWMQNAESY
ncbi:hypothetical protein ACHAXT_008148 [Thalassiosira profunda]